MDKKKLSEADIISKFIMPNIEAAGWDQMTQIRQEVAVRAGKVIARGFIGARQTVKRADIVLDYTPGNPLAVIEAKKNELGMDAGLQQALDYAGLLEVPFIFSSNGDGFVFHDKTNPTKREINISLADFPSPATLWQKYIKYRGLKPEQLALLTEKDYEDSEGKTPRYYQTHAINKTMEAIALKQPKILLVMATGTGKTYTAFQIIWRLWQSKAKKKILFLADRTSLIEQTYNNDFQPFATAMTVIKGHKIDKAFEIYLALYQGLTGSEDAMKAFKQVDRDFFDLVIVDECHRGSASENSSWREILNYFDSATQIGLTATPKETKDISSSLYFGDPVYTYSLKQGIEDGFLAPYKVVKVDLNIDKDGWTPKEGEKDKKGQVIENRTYNQRDYDRKLTIDERTELVAESVTAYLKRTDPMSKTIVFCDGVEHASRMREALINLNMPQVDINDKYVMRITGDDKVGKAQLGNFIDPRKKYPVIVTTSELMSTGVDAKTCKLIVLDQTIKSMTKFKQVIGRGTRIEEKYDKLWFTIMDFKNATDQFSDKEFDGLPARIINANPATLKDTDDTEFDRLIAGEDDPDDDDSNIDEQGVGYDVGSQGSQQQTDENDDNRAIKYHVCGVDVYKVAERMQYYGEDGKLVTESFKDYTRNKVKKQYTSLDDFVRKWHDADRKQVIIDELASHGVIWQALEEDISKELDPFDMICHVVYDQPPLTRKERADNVKKRNYFTKYSEVAQKVLNALLDEYADAGVDAVERSDALKASNIRKIGSVKEIKINAFGGKEAYNEAIVELEQALYSA
jgi:type I restriction enzyme R subunit